MNPWTLLLVGIGGTWYLRKYHPTLLPAVLRPTTTPAQAAAVASVAQASVPTPSPTAGLDPGMSSVEVATANQALASSSDPNQLSELGAVYGMFGYVNTSKALLAKANAISVAMAAGAQAASVTAAATSSAGQAASAALNAPSTCTAPAAPTS